MRFTIQPVTITETKLSINPLPKIYLFFQIRIVSDISEIWLLLILPCLHPFIRFFTVCTLRLCFNHCNNFIRVCLSTVVYLSIQAKCFIGFFHHVQKFLLPSVAQSKKFKCHSSPHQCFGLCLLSHVFSGSFKISHFSVENVRLPPWSFTNICKPLSLNMCRTCFPIHSLGSRSIQQIHYLFLLFILPFFTHNSRSFQAWTLPGIFPFSW